MSTIDELHEAGFRRMRLPNWNEHAYIEPDVLDDGGIGPWTTLYDVGHGVSGGEPIRILTMQCDGDTWESLLDQTKPDDHASD